MAFVITSLCVDVCDTGCVKVCPMDCIEGPISVAELQRKPRGHVKGVQLYINPAECIDCGACLPECPAQAIFEEDDVPEAFKASIEENAAFFQKRR